MGQLCYPLADAVQPHPPQRYALNRLRADLFRRYWIGPVGLTTRDW